jgi:carboxyl-terminal processing protease
LTLPEAQPRSLFMTWKALIQYLRMVCPCNTHWLKRLSLALALSLVMASSHAAAASATNSSLAVPICTRAEMESDLEHLTVRVKRAWAYAEDKRTFLGVNIDALDAAARRELDNVHDADGFYFVVEKYVAGLMDGHASVQPGHLSAGLIEPRQWPFKLMRLEGRFYVKALEDAAAPLQPGDEILSVNGVSLSNRFERTVARSTGSTPAGRERRAMEAMRYGKEKQLQVEAARTNGPSFKCEMPAPDRWAGRASAEEPIRWEKLKGNIGYLRLPSFAQDMKVWEEKGRGADALQAALESKKAALRKAFAELADTRALVLDLRGNGGGSDALGHFLAHCLCDTAAHPVYYSLSTRISEDLVELPEFAYYKGVPASAGDRRSPISLLPEKGLQRYPGRLAVLMDEACFSACDCFLNYLAIAAPRTIFVGRPNGAGAGAPRRVVTLPNSKMVVTFCVMQVWNLNGTLIESRPLKPTVPIQWTPEDLRQGRDPDLDAALSKLNQGA